MFSLNLYRYFERRFWLSRQVARHLSMDAPGPMPTQEGGIAIVLICKDVEDYVDEWIKYYQLAGVRHFYIYDNGSSDGTVAKAGSHRGNEISVIIHPWVVDAAAGQCEISPQEMAYAHAVLCYRHKHRWMAFLDIDEFLVPRKHLTIMEGLEHLNEFSNISLPWYQFGHCGHMSKPSEPCAFAYTRRHQTNRYHFDYFKCILDPCRIAMVSIHEFLTLDMGERTANEKGQVELSRDKNRATGFISNEYLQLNHYRTKSIEENNAKVKQVMYGELSEEREYRVGRQVRILSTNVVEDTAILDFLSRHGIKNSHEYSQYIKGDGHNLVK